MNTSAEKVEFDRVRQLHELFRQTAHCQIISDSMMRRGLADAFLLRVDGHAAGYAAVMNQIDPRHIRLFYLLPTEARHAGALLRDLVAVGNATHIEAQTNVAAMLTLLYDSCVDIVDEKILFADRVATQLACPGGILRRTDESASTDSRVADGGPVGEWRIEIDGGVVAVGGALTHYNPPYADIWMEVAEPERGKGFGSFLVQEIKRECYRRGYLPAARCSSENLASRRTLEKAGFAPCGRLLLGKIR